MRSAQRQYAGFLGVIRGFLTGRHVADVALGRRGWRDKSCLHPPCVDGVMILFLQHQHAIRPTVDRVFAMCCNESQRSTMTSRVTALRQHRQPNVSRQISDSAAVTEAAKPPTIANGCAIMAKSDGVSPLDDQDSEPATNC